MQPLIKVSLIALAACTGACSFQGDNADLHQYVQEVKRRPAGAIEPVPAFRPYEAFNYSAVLLRSPFDRPVVELQQLLSRGGKKIQPDFNREREHLENYPVGTLQMVGTIEKDKLLWGLVSDGQGGVHRIKVGNYLGRNHGKVEAITQAQIDFVEIVTDGLDGWVERPRSLRIEDKE